MARKRKSVEPCGLSVTDGEIEGAVTEYDAHRATVEEASEGAKAALEPLVERGVPKKAAKVALGLRKLDAGKRAAFFRGFDAMVEALGLRSQTELPLAQPGQMLGRLQ